jgi:hypothetical protein
MPDPEIPTPADTPSEPDYPFEGPSGEPVEIPPGPSDPDEGGDGRPTDFA